MVGSLSLFEQTFNSVGWFIFRPTCRWACSRRSRTRYGLAATNTDRTTSKGHLRSFTARPVARAREEGEHKGGNAKTSIRGGLSEPVSARIEPVSIAAKLKIPDIGKSRPETGAGSPPKSCRSPASQGLADATPRTNAPELRDFLPRPQSVRKQEDSNSELQLRA